MARHAHYHNKKLIIQKNAEKATIDAKLAYNTKRNDQYVLKKRKMTFDFEVLIKK